MDRLHDPVYRRRALELLADALLAAFAFALAFALRFVDDEFVLPDRYETMLVGSIVFVAVGKALVLEILGQHRQWWRYFRLPDLWPLCRSLAIASALMVLIFALAKPYDYSLPRSVIVLDFILSCVLLGGARLVRRSIAERPDRAARARRARTVLVVGAGSGGQMVARELQLNPNLGARAIGFIDDDPSKRGMRHDR
jgi:FlaA1/EpsC-like NDP-sugar epimerase